MLEAGLAIPFIMLCVLVLLLWDLFEEEEEDQ